MENWASSFPSREAFEQLLAAAEARRELYEVMLSDYYYKEGILFEATRTVIRDHAETRLRDQGFRGVRPLGAIWKAECPVTRNHTVIVRLENVATLQRNGFNVGPKIKGYPLQLWVTCEGGGLEDNGCSQELLFTTMGWNHEALRVPRTFRLLGPQAAASGLIPRACAAALDQAWQEFDPAKGAFGKFLNKVRENAPKNAPLGDSKYEPTTIELGAAFSRVIRPQRVFWHRYWHGIPGLDVSFSASFKPLAHLSEAVSKPTSVIGVGRVGMDIHLGPNVDSLKPQGGAPIRSSDTLARHVVLSEPDWVYVSVSNDNEWLAIEYTLTASINSLPVGPKVRETLPPAIPRPIRLNTQLESAYLQARSEVPAAAIYLQQIAAAPDVEPVAVKSEAYAEFLAELRASLKNNDERQELDTLINQALDGNEEAVARLAAILRRLIAKRGGNP